MYILHSLLITLIGVASVIGTSVTATTNTSSTDPESMSKPGRNPTDNDPLCLDICTQMAMNWLGHGKDNEQYYCANIKIMEELIELCMMKRCQNQNIKPGTNPAAPQLRHLGCISCFKCCYKCHSRCRGAPSEKYCKHQDHLRELAAGENGVELLELDEEFMTNETALAETEQAILGGDVVITRWAPCEDLHC